MFSCNHQLMGIYVNNFIYIYIYIYICTCLLGGGPFSRAAVLMSHNYMIHHPPKSEFKWILSDMTSEFNIERFILHISSYLQSIEK
jgi:hypothetical protein